MIAHGFSRGKKGRMREAARARARGWMHQVAPRGNRGFPPAARKRGLAHIWERVDTISISDGYDVAIIKAH